jgi:uncharacterized protein YjbI with pentapeptide repeats
VGPWSKALLVVGRRVWTEKIFGTAISEPHPFATMPLGYANSFGGPGFPRNPAGKGCGTPELPNVEYAGARVYSKSDRPEPAGFGPLNPAWPQRSGKVGSQYGARWKEERAPFYAEDFDWSYFNAAPSDQQLPGYLRGDEEISFLNLHPAAPNVSARLPGLRVRAFAKTTDGVVREARMNLDTLLAELDKEKLVLTWRGLVPVAQDDLGDVRTVLIASEKLADAELPLSHYLEILAAFEADPLEIDKHVPGGRKAQATLRQAMDDDAAHPERTPEERALAFLKNDDVTMEMVPEDHRAGMAGAIAQAKEKLAAPPPTLPARSARPNPGEAMRTLVAKLEDGVKKLRALTLASGEPTKEVEELEQMLNDPQMRKMIAGLAPAEPEEIGPGKDLSERNLFRMDLTGRDLSGANLAGAVLFGARLSGAKLVGANLKEAILMEADLSAADLSDADLSRSVLGRARAPGANLQRVKLDQALLQDADLRGATLGQATCHMMILSGSDLTDANLRGCNFSKAFADSAVLERSDFSEAKLVNCTFQRAKAGGVILARALLTNSSFSESDLRRANLVEARGEGTNWMRAVLEEADFRFAILPSAHFMEAKATEARFSGADLRGSEFLRACLDRVDFVRANLFEASFNKAIVNGTKFVDANLYQSRFLGAFGKGCDFNGANLKRAILPS